METSVLIQCPKTLCSFPPPQWCSIDWSILANWPQRYSSLKVWTKTTNWLLYYKLTLWAFGSGELKTEWLPLELLKLTKTTVSSLLILKKTVIFLFTNLAQWNEIHLNAAHSFDWRKGWTSQCWNKPIFMEIRIGRSTTVVVNTC